MQFYHAVSFLTLLCVLAYTGLRCASEETESSNGGDDWMYLLDDYGTTLVLNFSTFLEDAQDMIVGDAYFYLYTRNNQYNAEELIISELDEDHPFKSQYFNKSNDVKVVTHGWRSSERVGWLQNIKNSLLREFDVNVITVDWYELSKSEFYPLAAISTRYVGTKVAIMLEKLILTYNVMGQSIHLIGHSLGAHVMGYAGMFSSEKVFRITGLDPARPLFEVPVMPSDFRLDKNDAQFVDIIHTCGGVYGYRGSYGHADFYPNNGMPMQPGCSGARQAVDACSHSRSYQYFEESIEYTSENGFISYACDNWEKFDKDDCKNNPTSSMGYPASADSFGDYYLRTRNESKYAN